VTVRRLDVLVVDDDVGTLQAAGRSLAVRHAVRQVIGLRLAVDEVVRRVPDALVAAYDLTPYRGDALLAMIAREHPQVLRVLLAPALTAVLDGAAHHVLTAPYQLGELLAALGGDD
jgi:hypothetical protein